MVIDWVERELTAVLAVAIVLAFIFSRSLATDTATQQSIVSTGTGVVYQQTGSTALWDGGSSIILGQDLEGPNADLPPTKWVGGPVVNMGRSLYILGNATVTITATPGTYHLGVTAQDGSVTVNGVLYNFTGYGTQTKTVSITNGQLTIGMSAGLKIYTIEATTEDSSAGGSTPLIPITSFSVLPSYATLVLNPLAKSTISPITFVRNAVGATVSPSITWSSSDSSVATVSTDGVVTAISVGSVTITATVTGTTLSASTSLHIVAQVSAPMVDVTPATPSKNESTTGNALSNLVGSLLNNKTSAPATGGSAEQSAPAAAPTQETTTNAQASSDVLDAFAATQALNYTAAGTTEVKQSQINDILKTQTTVGQKIAARAKIAVNEFTTTIREMVLGRTIQVGNQTVTKPSLGQIIVNWLKSRGILPGTGAMSATVPGEEEKN